MQIFINHLPAALKQGTSFDYIAENRYFSGADSYSLTMAFPLKDCPQNIAIFGHINRKDVVPGTLLFDCEIRHNATVLYGAVTITEIDDVEVKCQFLQGQSVNNYDIAFDEIYINELELGYPVDFDTAAQSPDIFPVSSLSNSYADGQNWQALPWVNNHSGNLQNELIKDGSNRLQWGTGVLTFQPYLVYIIESIFSELGYTTYLDDVRNSRFANLLVCNTLPSIWHIYNFAKALPHWTLTEFLEQLEMLLGGFFEIDRDAKSVRFLFTRKDAGIEETVKIDQVVNEFTCQCSEKDGQSAKGFALKYADCDHRMWKYYSCQQYIDRLEANNRANPVLSVDDAINSVNYVNSTPVSHNRGLTFCQDTPEGHKYYIARTRKVETRQDNNLDVTYGLQRINLCGSKDTGEDTRELKMVPVWLDELSHNSGYVMFIQCPELMYEDSVSDDNNVSDDEYNMTLDDSNKQNEFFDKIYLGFWDGGELYGTELHPYIDCVDFITGIDYIERQNTLDISVLDEHEYMDGLTLDKSFVYSFRFIADWIPDPRALFYIRGRMYVCEKITATFDERGMSQLLKGEFYPVVG